MEQEGEQFISFLIINSKSKDVGIVDQFFICLIFVFCFNCSGGTPEQDWYDPSEPRYCICNQVSYGDMVACDNEDVSLSQLLFDIIFIFCKI